MEQLYFKSALNRAVDHIQSIERLTYDGSVVELCKILLVKFYYEKKNRFLLSVEAVERYLGTKMWNEAYEELYRSYIPLNLFKGWDKLSISKQSFENVVQELSIVNMYQGDGMEYGKEFTMFLRSQLGGYYRDNSTPAVLAKYILDAINLENVHSVFDPCCGLGGFLIEAHTRKGKQMKLSGCDIDVNMVNITRLHLKIYGYEGDRFFTDDFTGPKESYQGEMFDCILAHLPSRKMTYSMAGGRYSYFMNRQSDESLFIGRILRMLTPNGIAAIIVSNDLMDSKKEADIREEIFKMGELINITRFEDMQDEDDPTRLITYHILFIRSKHGNSCQDVTATLFEENASKQIIEKSAAWLKNLDKSNCQMPNNSIYFKLAARDEWNISLMFVRSEISKRYPAVKLDDIVYKRRERVNIEDYKEYKLLRVRSRGLGVEVKTKEDGNDIPGDRYAAYRGDLIISSFEADRGGIGIVPEECDGGLVIKDLYVFEIDKSRVNPDYLALVLCSDQVQKQFQKMNKGRFALARLSFKKVLSVLVPLPDMSTQRMLARNLQRYINKAQKAEEELKEGRKEFSKMLFGDEK